MDIESRVNRTRLGAVAAAWASSRWIEVEGRRVRYREAGSGMPVVLVHGLGVSADYWVRNATVIAAAGYRVLAADLPGFGRTSGPVEGLDVLAQVEAVRDWARAMKLGPGVYVGHSLSCQVVMELAARYPKEVRGLVLAAPTGEGASFRRLARQAVGFLRDIRRESLKLTLIVIQAYLRAGPLRVLRTWKMGASHDPIPLLPRIECSGIVVLGEHDPVVALLFAETIAQGMPGGRVVIVPDGSHGVIFDKTGSFNQAVVDFLGEVRG